MNRLLFFTQTYPRENGEAFIENEIAYLADAFDEVVILPWTGRGQPTRPLPANCRVLPPLTGGAVRVIARGIFSLAPVAYFARHFFTERAYTSLARAVKYVRVSVFCRAILASRGFRCINGEFRDATLYSYWGIGTAYLLPFVKGERKIIARFHGGDLYAGTKRGGYIPFRPAVYARLTRAVFISRHGMEYALARHGAFIRDARVSYLGTTDHGPGRGASTDGRARLVSCSRVVPVKRVHLILEALRRVDIPVTWTHLGGGPGLERLAAAARSLPAHVEVRLPGEMSNREVIDYYRHHPVDLFLNVSESEGLPVSIMEAISFDIPVLATRVGGTAEIVTPGAGTLVDPGISPDDLARRLLETLRLAPAFSPRACWEASFSAARNYPAFVRDILLEG
jgi:glycosyltransferase involved in cell wall biosynthesis